MGGSCATSQQSNEPMVRTTCEKNLRGQAFLAKAKQKIRVEGFIKTTLPEALQKKMRNYSISYRIKYGKQQFIWAENAQSLEHTTTQSFSLEYQINADNQNMNVVLEFKPNKTKKEKPSMLSPKHGNFLTESEGNMVIINLQAYFDIHELLMLNGDFGTPPHLNAKELKAAVINEESKGDQISNLYPPVTVSLKEIKPDNLKKIRFKVKGRFNKKNRVMLTIFEHAGSERRFIYESKPVAGPSSKDTRLFETIEINTDVFEGEKIATSVIEIVAQEVIFDKKGEKIRPFGSE